MNYLTPILYGLIIGHWILHVKDRLTPGKVEGRFAIVGMHSGKEEFILVGRTSDKDKALEATRYLEDNTMFYIGIAYDMLDPDDRVEFERRIYSPYVEKEDEIYVHEARQICGSGD